MAEKKDAGARQFVIAQISDIHCGDPRFDANLLARTIREVRDLEPDLIIIPGDLTASGYRDEFEEARCFLDALDTGCPMIVIPGNHDSRNVGWEHFIRLMGAAQHAVEYPFAAGGQTGNGRVKLVAVDSTRPDVDHGNVGHILYDWIAEEFDGDYAFRIFVLHHHLVSVPGTGRERGVVLDGGDVLWRLGRANVDLVLCGHKHVPWVWATANAFLVASGTAGTHRLRGNSPPSYNVIRITPDELEVTFRSLDEQPHLVQHFERRPRHRQAREHTSNAE